MKPHIRKTRGVWTCRMAQKAILVRADSPLWVFVPYGKETGHGYTPREAYADWQEQTRAARSAASHPRKP